MKYYIGNNLLSYSGYTDATIEDCFAYCSSKPVLGLDIETKRKYKKNLYSEKNYKPGLDPYLSEICMLQIGDLENQFVIDARVISLAFLAPILENPDILKVGHNLKFEGSHLYINYNISLINVWDTMICERILYNGLPLSFSLEALSYRYLDSSKKITQTELFVAAEDELDYLLEPTEDEVINWMDSNFTFVIDKSIRLDFVEIDDKPFTQKQLDYACDDILMPLLIYSKQKDGRYAGDSFYYPEKGFRIENAFTQVLAKVELKGVKVNTEGWKSLYDKNFKKRYEIKTILDKFVEQHYPQFAGQYNLFDDNTTCQIEWESSTQVVKFFKFLQICPKEYSKQTKKVDYTVSAKALFKLLTNENKDLFYKEKLQEFSSKDDFQSLFINYLIYKKYQLLTTTFGLEWLNWIHPITHRVHTSIKQLLNIWVFIK